MIVRVVERVLLQRLVKVAESSKASVVRRVVAVKMSVYGKIKLLPFLGLYDCVVPIRLLYQDRVHKDLV